MAQTYEQRKKTKAELNVWIKPEAMEQLKALCVITKQDKKTVIEGLIRSAHDRMSRQVVPVEGEGQAAAAARVNASGARRAATVVATGEVAQDGRVRSR